MDVDERGPWIRRLGWLWPLARGKSAAPPGCERPGAIEPDLVTVVSSGPAAARSTEDWRSLLEPGGRVAAAWDAGGREIVVQGEVRLSFDDAVWLWLEREVEPGLRPIVGQAVQLLVPRADALRTVPCRLTEETHGGSLQVVVSGRVTRVQRRDDVRARVELPPVSAVRLTPTGRPVGVLGVHLLDVSAGGVAFQCPEPLTPDEQLRLVLHLDDGPPLTPTVRVLAPGRLSRGRFGAMPERERRRIVQFVYRQELEERRRAMSDRGAD